MPKVRRCRHVGCHLYAESGSLFCTSHRDDEIRYERSNQYMQQKMYSKIKRYAEPDKAEQNKFYHTKKWRSLRNIVINRDLNLCQYCRVNGKLTEGKIVDHIMPSELFAGHRADLENLVYCCQSCHHYKTIWEQHYYGTGKNNKRTGNPPIRDIKIISKLMMMYKR